MLFFRADGNEKIGAGHIMRCLSIASAACEQGEQILFYTAGNEFSKVIQENDIENIVINSDFMKMESELVFLKKEILSRKPEFIFVDSYYVTKMYLASILEWCHSYGGKLIYIDDVMAFAYPCDFLINYNIFGPDMKETYIKMYLENGIKEGMDEFPRLMLGLDYVPLRKEFTNLPPRVARPDAKDILVSTGGADTEHIALEIARAVVDMSDEERADYVFHILVGAMNTDKVAIEIIAANCKNIVVHYNVKDMISLMWSCDVAVSAAGSTLYELCATQTPTITYVVADNQILGAEGFEKAGLIEYAGDVRKSGKETLARCLVDKSIKLVSNIQANKHKAIRISNGTRNIMLSLENNSKVG